MNEETLQALADDRDRKKHLLEKVLKELIDKIFIQSLRSAS